MAITRATFVHVYGEIDQQFFAKSGALPGCTGGTGSLRRLNWIYAYDRTVRQVPMRLAR